MNLTVENSKIIDAAAYKRMVISAAATVENNSSKLNDLNVFPVPDGDTGSNMALTTKSAAKELMSYNSRSIGDIADTAAKAMLRGARGNSGVITSLLFRGISTELRELESCDSTSLSKALQSGVAAAYKAVANPAEGTILTVARLGADAAVTSAKSGKNPKEVLDDTIASAKIALSQTTEMNPTLKKAGVVDAGGYGWVLILEAMRDSLCGIDITPTVTVSEESANFSDFSDEDITFTYCTEFIVSRTNDKNPDLLKAELGKVGDSLVLVDDDEIIKVHVHTDDPGNVLHLALEYGQFVSVKVENMRIQHTNKISEGFDAANTQIAEKPEKYGVVAVAPGDGIAQVFTELGADAIVSGGQTMNPSTDDILNAINKVNAENIFVLPNNKNIILAAQQTQALTDKNVIIIPSKSVPQGVCAMQAYDTDLEVDDLTSAMTEYTENVVTMQITTAVRDSDMGGLGIAKDDYIALYNGELIGGGRDENSLVNKLISKIKETDRNVITIYYGEDIDDDSAEKVFVMFANEFGDDSVSLIPGGQSVYRYIISAE